MASAERGMGAVPAGSRGRAPGQEAKGQSPPEAEQFLARDVIYTSRAYATMSVSVCL